MTTKGFTPDPTEAGPADESDWIDKELCGARIWHDIRDADGAPATDFQARCTLPQGHLVPGSSPHVGVSQGFRLTWEPPSSEHPDGIVHRCEPL